ncbi:MAG: hypothetical protein AAF657_31250 [Acidobacteriota bacterium]
MQLPRRLLWIDGSGGAIAGILMLLLLGWLTKWYALPRDLVLLIGCTNLAYGTYSLSLARRSQRPKALIHLLIVANLVWGALCLRWAVLHFETASFWGLAHLIGEGLYVGGLGCLEWRWREQLLTA